MPMLGSWKTEAGMLLILDGVDLMYANAGLGEDRGRDAAP